MTMSYPERIAADRARRADREARFDALQRSLPTLTFETAAAMGDGWSRGDTDHHRSTLNGPDGLSLLVRTVHGEPDHVTISGQFPRDSGAYLSDVDAGSIRVRADRGPAVIAREIKRRLLPVYVPALAVALERATRHRADLATRDAVASDIATLLGARPPHQSPNVRPSEGSVVVYLDRNGLYVRAEVRPGGYVRAEVSGTATGAMRSAFAALGVC